MLLKNTLLEKVTKIKREDFMASYSLILNHKGTQWVVVVVMEGCVDTC